MKTTGFVIILVILTCWSTIRPFSQVIPDNNSLQSDKFTLNHYCGGFIQPQGDDQKGVYNGSLNSIGCYYDDHILDLQIYDPEPWDVFYTGNPSHHRSFSDFLNLQAGLLHNALLDDSSNDLFPDKWMDFNKNFQFTSDKIVLDDSLFSREWFDYHPANFPIATDKGWFTARVRTKKESQVTDPCQTYTCGHRFGFTVNLAGGFGPGGNPPAWLTASLASDDAVLLQWDMNPLPGPWIQWCSDNSANQVGLIAGGTFYAMAHWLPGQLPNVENPAINCIAFYPTSNSEASYNLKIFQGENAGTLLFSYPVQNYTEDSWNEYFIEPSIPIDLSQELWVGYEVTHLDGDQPAGCDEGPAITGFGDMFSVDGQSWLTLSSYNLDYNWNIKASLISLDEKAYDDKLSYKCIPAEISNSLNQNIISSTKSFTSSELNGFNVYRDDSLIAQLPVQLDYLDQDLSTGTYTYTVRALYTGGMSDPSPSAQIYVPGTANSVIEFFPLEFISTQDTYTITDQLLMIYNTGTDVLNYSISILYKNEPLTDNTSGFCVENLYTTGCEYGDGLISWKFSNVSIPEIPCTGDPSWYHLYGEYTHQIEVCKTYELIVEAGYENTYFDVWIDWDEDSYLNNEDELILNDAICTSANTPFNFPITIPWWVSPGYFLMRARTNWGAPVIDACDTYDYGNCSDFVVSSLNISPVYWLSATPDAGSINPGDSTSVIIEFNSIGLNYGTYYANLVIASNAPGSPHEIPVSLLMSSSPACLNSDSQLIVENHNNPPQITSQIISLQNTCVQPVNFTVTATYNNSTGEDMKAVADSDDSFITHQNEWLSVEPITGWLISGQTVDITVCFNSIGLTSPGTYYGSLNFFTNYYGDTLSVPVELILGSCSYPPVSNLECSYSDPQTVELSWLPPIMETLRWDSGENCNGIGGTTNFSVAVRWSPEQLTAYTDYWLTHILFYPASDQAAYTLKVWKGEQAENLLLNQPIEDYVPDQWNTVMLETNISVTSGEWYWMGYEVTDFAWNYPAGADCGTATAGYGDMIQFDGQTWHSLSTSFGHDNNWNIAGILVPGNNEKAGSYLPNQYNVYRNDELIATLPSTTCEYTDSLVPMEIPDYLVGAVYDECESMSDTCSPAPISWIQVEPESFTFNLLGGEIITDQFQITNTGHVCTLMDFAIEISYILPAPESSAGKTQEWLTVTPTSGQVAGQTAETIALTVNTAGLRAGTYYAAIDITTNAQNIQHFIVPVFLDIIISVDESDKMDIQIFPNPTEGMFTISGNRMEAKINIINAFGLEILNTKINLPSVIDLSPWPAGIYFIKIESFEKRWLDKLFVK